MIHVIRACVAERGYGTYVFDSVDGSGRAETDDGLRLPAGFIECKQTLDDLLDRVPSRPHLCVVRAENADDDLLLSYGSFVQVPDEFGREGLTFVHAVLVPSPRALSTLIRLSSALVPRGIARLRSQIADLAVGRLDPDAFLESLDRQVNGGPQPVEHSTGRASLEPILSISHDCPGAGYAWLAMVESHLAAPGPWRIADEAASKDGATYTSSSCPAARRSLLLSECMLGSMDDRARLDRIRTLVTEGDDTSVVMSPPRIGERPVGVAAVERAPVPGPAPSAGGDGIGAGRASNRQHGTDASPVAPAATHDFRAAPRPSPWPQPEPFPERGEIVALQPEEMRRDTDRLVLRSESRSYRVAAVDVESGAETSGYFVLEVRESLLSQAIRGRRTSTVILAKDTLPPAWQVFVRRWVPARSGRRDRIGAR